MERKQAFVTVPLSRDQWYQAIIGSSNAKEIAQRLNSGRAKLWAEPILRRTSPSQSVLELGSGTGQLSGVLARNGRRVTLSDFSAEALDFGKRLFDYAKLEANFVHVDVLKPFPFKDGSFDCVWSSGLLEHFTNDELTSIMKESARISKDMVISMVPNANSLAYRLGKRYQDSRGMWRWGQEEPKYTLKGYFQRAGLKDIIEYSIDPGHSFLFLNSLRPVFVRDFALRLRNLVSSRILKFLNQGYLLVTYGEKQ